MPPRTNGLVRLSGVATAPRPRSPASSEILHAMWRTMNRFATATLIATSALALAFGTEAQAAPVQTYAYSTTGVVGAPDASTASAASVGPIGFEGVSSGTMTTPGAFQLGSFTVAALPPSVSLTYEDTGYTIYLTGFGTGATYRIDGVLNGTLNGAGMSNLVASVTSVKGWGKDGSEGTAPIALSDLRIIAPQVIAAPAGFKGSLTPLFGQVAPGAGLPVPAPEPSSIAAVAVGVAAWGLSRRQRDRFRSRRRAA